MTKSADSIRPSCGGRPTQQEALEIQQRILDTARHLFLKEGFEKTSMDLIASEAKLSKRTLYARYGGKAALFEAMVNRLVEDNLREFRNIKVHPCPLPKQLHQLALRLLEVSIVPELIALERVIAGEAHQFPGLAVRVYCNGAVQVRELITRLLSKSSAYQGQSDEQLKQDADIFIAMVVLPPLRKATLGGDFSEAIDHGALERSIKIFLNGIEGGGPV